MTVSSQTSNEMFNGNGVTTVWPLPFRFFNNTDIHAYLVDPVTQAVTPLAEGTDYSLAGAGLPEQFGAAQGNITTLTPVASGKQLYVERVMDAEQLTDIVNQGRFFPEVHEDVFDRLTMLIQQFTTWISRALVRPIGKNYYDAEGRNISNVADPVQPQDASTKQSVETFVSDILITGQGPANLAANVLYIAPNGAVRTVQNMSSKTDPALGASLIGYKNRTVYDRLAEVVSTNDFFVAGMVDYSIAIQAAIDYLGSIGGGIAYIPSGHFNVASTIINRYSGVMVRGAGTGNEHDVAGAIDAPTALTWTGAAGGTMIDFSPTPGAGNRRISGGGFAGIGLYGQSVAAVGLSAKSVMNADIDIYVQGFTTGAVDLNVVTTLGEAKDLRDCRIKINGKQTNVADGFTLRIGGDSAANVCYNKISLRSLYLNGTSFICGNSDNNTIDQWSFKFTGGTGKGTECLGGSTAQLASRANTWNNLYAGAGGFYVYGAAEGYAVASNRHRCLDWDNDNTQPEPTISVGASFSRIDKDQRLTWTEIGLERTQPNQMHLYGGGGARLIRLSFSTGATGFLGISHGAGSVSMVANSDTLADVGMGFSTRGAGFGDLYASNFASKRFSWSSVGLSFNGAAVIAKPTVTGAKGGNAALASLITALSNIGLITDSTT